MIARSEPNPLRRLFCLTALLAGAATTSAATAATAPTAAEHATGVLRLASAHPVDETVARIKQSVEAKGIRYFVAIDQQQLGASANLPIRKSTLVLFGNPPLGVQFIGRALNDGAVIAAANLFQANSDWHTRRPPIT